MTTTPEALFASLTPLIEGLGLQLHDVEFSRSLIRVTVFSNDGVSIDALAEANRAVSAYLDDHDPFEDRYTLEVSSPGIERKLRTPAHFGAAVGEIVTIKTVAGADSDAERRFEGELKAASDAEIIVAIDDTHDRHVPYDQIERARTVYRWGPMGKPSPSRAGAPRGARRGLPRAPERVMTP